MTEYFRINPMFNSVSNTYGNHIQMQFSQLLNEVHVSRRRFISDKFPLKLIKQYSQNNKKKRKKKEEITKRTSWIQLSKHTWKKKASKIRVMMG